MKILKKMAKTVDAQNEKDPVFVVIGRKNFYNEKEFVEKLNSIQTQ